VIAAGVDYGVRRVAMVVINRHGPVVYELLLDKKEHPPGEQNDDDALEAIFQWTYDVTLLHTVRLVVIESPIQGVSVNVKVGLRLAKVAGTLAVACRRAGSSTLSVGPTEWKKAITGHGNADKDQVTEWLRANHPTIAALCGTQDASDAACMALHAQAILGG